ncbi:hypothetical protein BOX15_Mlig019145g1 [Macrostomum lignano]|uniref:Uncharacterized protein n=1 Tax=Macrostomum lignano TaxID=282301 RepID=A0A267FBL0_9PLAT|nr:hypothetical protein BOX15_Mlig019145g1 [Macrostomum lignano]
MFGWIPWYGPNQAAFQRFASLPSLTKAKWSILLNVPGVALLFILLAFAGYTLFSFYTIRGCDPYSDGLIKSVNQLLPYYVRHEMDIPALPGIIVACILSGAFSTTSTVLNSQAAVTVIDFLQPCRQLTDRQATLATKWLVVVYGLLGSILAFASAQLTGISLKQISGSLLNATTGATLGIYLLATCVPKSTWQSAFIGSLVSLALVGWLCLGAFISPGVAKAIMLPLATRNCSRNEESAVLQSTTLTADWMTSSAVLDNASGSSLLDEYFYSISFQWYGLIGAASCLLVGLLLSLPTLLNPDAEAAEEKYILPVMRRFVKCQINVELSEKPADKSAMSDSGPPVWGSYTTQQSTYL